MSPLLRAYALRRRTVAREPRPLRPSARCGTGGPSCARATAVTGGWMGRRHAAPPAGSWGRRWRRLGPRRGELRAGPGAALSGRVPCLVQCGLHLQDVLVIQAQVASTQRCLRLRIVLLCLGEELQHERVDVTGRWPGGAG